MAVRPAAQARSGAERLGLGGGVRVGRLDRPRLALQPPEHLGRARRPVCGQPGDHRRRAGGRRPHTPGHGDDEQRETGLVREFVGHGRPTSSAIYGLRDGLGARGGRSFPGLALLAPPRGALLERVQAPLAVDDLLAPQRLLVQGVDVDLAAALRALRTQSEPHADVIGEG
jgi:hypothetical protein